MSNLMGLGDIARALETTPARVKGLLEGVEPSVRIQNDRVALFTRTQVREAVYEAHKAAISFLGYLPPEQSYDSVTQVDSEASSL